MILTLNEEFIMVWDNVFSNEMCVNTINHFEYAKSMGLTYSRQRTEGIPTTIKKDDTYFPMDEEMEELQIANSKIFNSLRDILQIATNQYMQEYPGLADAQIAFNTFRLQKTNIGGGYHAWHHERSNGENAYRQIACIFYLNDVQEGGETEFFHQHKRVEPKAGRLVIWPSGFTHVHRGNPPLSNKKYVVTTWGVIV
jgi:hypothetical protein